MAKDSKVHSLHEATENKEQTDVGTEIVDEGGQGGNAALWVSFLAIIVIIVAYFSMDAKFRGVETRLAAVPVLETKVGGLEKQVADLSALPEKVKKVMLADQLAELSVLMSRVASNLDTDADKALAAKIGLMMGELQSGLDGEAAPAPAAPEAAD